MTGDELEAIVERLLTEGVPVGIVARVFNLDDALVKEASRLVKVKRYGTDDITEYAEQLQWDAIDHARQIIENGSESDKVRFLGGILGKQIALQSRRTPQSAVRAQENVIEMLRQQREGDIQPVEEQSPFVVRAVEE